MNLAEFLEQPSNSRAREYLLTTRLIHDLLAAAANRGYQLLVYQPTVDADGFDLIVDDRDRLVPIQLKSIKKGGGATEWSIFRTLLRPPPQEAALYGFEESPCGCGRGGAVILITASAIGASVAVEYAYTDIDVLTVLWMGILPKTRSQHVRLDRLRREIETEAGGKVYISKSAFIRAASPEHLLALAGLHSRFPSNWRTLLRRLLLFEHLGTALPAPQEKLNELIRTEILTSSEARLPEPSG